MAKKAEPPQPTSWTIYEIAAKADMAGRRRSTGRGYSD
jgi:hypothetical protein